MKFLGLVLIFATLHALCEESQTTTNGKAKASGVCGVVAHSGSNDTINVNIQHCGIGEKQGQQIIELLNIIKNDRASDKFSEKLAQLIELASKPYQVQNCVGSNCVQNGNLYDMRTYRAPKGGPNIVNIGKIQLPAIAATPEPVWSSDLVTRQQQTRDFRAQIAIGMAHQASNPGVSVHFHIDAAFQNPMFLFRCNRPCAPAGVSVREEGATSFRYSSESRNRFLGIQGDNNAFALVLGDYPILTPELVVVVDAISLDAQPIELTTVESYVQ